MAQTIVYTASGSAITTADASNVLCAAPAHPPTMRTLVVIPESRVFVVRP